MSDQGQPPASPQSPPAPSTPDGRDSTILTPQGNAPAPAGKEGEAAPQTPPAEAPPPADIAKLTFPEGYSIKNDELMGKFGEYLKSNNLTQEQAQGLVNIYGEAAKFASEESTRVWKSTIDSWESEIKEDKEVGGDRLQANVAKVSKLFDDPRFATPGLREALNLTGAGSNPAIARFLVKVANTLSEGSAVSGEPGSASKAPESAAKALYPNLRSQME